MNIKIKTAAIFLVSICSGFHLLGQVDTFQYFIPHYSTSTELMESTANPPHSIPFIANEISPWQKQNLNPNQIRNINIILIFDQWTYNEVTKQSVPPAFVFPTYNNLQLLANYLHAINSAVSNQIPSTPSLSELTSYCVAQYTANQNGKSFTKKTDYEALKKIIYSIQKEYVKEIKKSACMNAAQRNIPPELIIAMIENETAYYPNYLTEPGPSACVGLGQIRMGDNKNVAVPGVIGNLERFKYLADDVISDSLLIDPFVNIGLICQKLVYDYLGTDPSKAKPNHWSTALLNYSPVGGYVDRTKKLLDIVISRPYLMTDATIYFKDFSVLTTNTEELQASGWTLFPNPVNDQLNIKSAQKNTSEVRLIIYDQNGKMIFSNASQSTQNPVDLPPLQSGIYYIQLNQTMHKIFVK
ncbi:MAG: T9SS type A sorting domain-containing protein [Bacteroidetes bacterium]|nr:T9SS type A sorting domain-containing protein [Bacteroidota bacterium]